MTDKNDVTKGEAIDFADDVVRTIRPLTIRQLRKFVPIIDKLGSTENAATMNDEEIDIMMEAAKVILSKVDPGLAEDDDRLEEAVDLIVFNKMMNVAMGQASPEA